MDMVLAGLLGLASVGSFLIGEPVLGALLGGAGSAVYVFGERVLPWSERDASKE
jgi:hypothetical protein